MFHWIKQKCFVNLEQEKQKNNLLLFVIAVTYTVAEVNVLQNNSFESERHLIFLFSCILLFLFGFNFIRITTLVNSYKYIMMTMLMIITIVQICVFNHLPEVYQTVYFNMALSLIYLDGHLTLFVGAITLLFTWISRVIWAYYFSPFLEYDTLNIPIGIFFETTMVLWAVTKIGGSFSLILKKNNEINKLLHENEIQLNIIKNQKKVLEGYTAEVETLVKREERNRMAAQLQSTLGHSLTCVILEVEKLVKLLENKQEVIKTNDITNSITNTVRLYKDNLLQSFIDEKLENIIVDIEHMIQRFIDSTGIQVEFDVFNEVDYINQHYIYVILRGVQESLIKANFAEATNINIELQITQEHIKIQISDNGVGKEVTEQYGVEFSDLRTKIYDMHGSMDIKYFKEKGSVVTILLPQTRNANKRINVLIVDSEPFVRQGIELYLSGEPGITVLKLLESGKQAIDFCKNQLPDIVLLDVSLKEMDGVKTTKIIKETYPQVRVIVLTHEQNATLVAESILAGADAFLLKTTSPRNLALSIRFLCNGGNLLSKETSSLIAGHILKSESLQEIEKKIVHQDLVKEYGLKAKEVQILQMLAEDYKYREIATNLFLSEGTIRNYISNIYTKLGVQHKEQAIEKAIKTGVLTMKK